MLHLNRLLSLVLTFMFGGLTALRAEDIRFPANSGVWNIKSAPYNAAGDGVTDDTAAFQAALDASAAAGATIYIPNGTYRLTNTLSWPGDGGANITLQGQSRAGAILRLADSAPGFTSAAAPKVLLDGKGNHIPQRFANSLRNLTVDTGSGNLGAVAVQYYANNMGVCRDVTIRGSGLVGLEMSHARANGPNLVKNVTIDGFQTGIRTGYGMESLTFEHITLRNQSVLGWLNENAARTVNGTNHLPAGQILSIRGLTADALAVPVLRSATGHVVLIDSTLSGTGGASALPALENGVSGQMLLRNVSAPGYARVLRDGVANITGTTLTEWVSDTPVSQFPSTGATLNLPIQETPDVPADDPSTWANIKSFGATNWNAAEGSRFDNDAPAIQAAIDSGATTVFIPAGSYRVLSQINVRGNVRRIVGVGGVSSVGAGNNGAGVPYQGIVWAVQSGTHPVVVIENLSCGSAQDMTGVDNQSSRTLVLRDLVIQPPKFTGTGDIFIENVCASFWEFNGQRAWARQFNVEHDGNHIINRGATLWIFGLKTEDLGYILDASNGARTEILGGMVYSLDDATATPMIRNVESQLSFSLVEYLGSYGKPYNVLVEETAQGVTNSLTRLNGSAVRYPAVWSQNNDGTTTSTTGVVGNQFALYCGPSVVSSLTVRANGNGIPDNAVTPSLANHTDFGSVQSGASLTRTYTVTNTGASPVSFTGSPRVALSGTHAADFSVAQDLPATLAPGAAVVFRVTFTPAATGTRTATVAFANSNTPDGTHNFAINGTGTAPAPDITLSAAGASATVPQGSSGSASFAVQNTGLGPLAVTPVVPAGYTFSSSDQLGGPAYEWIEIASGDNVGTRVTAIEGQDDLRSGTYDLGFNFPFNGSSFSKLRVHTNGYVELTNTAAASTSSSEYNNAALPASAAPANALLPYWDDLYFINANAEASTFSRAYVKTLGTDTAVVTFSSVSFFQNDLRTKRMTFQVVLKRSGEIRMNYQFLDNDLSCTVGIQHAGTTAVQSLHNTVGTRLKNQFSLRFAPPPVVGGNTWLGAPSPSPLNVAAVGTANLSLPFSTAGLTVGESYFTQLRLNSNDPDESPAYLPVTLTVAAPGTPAPSGLGATAQTGPQVALAWTDPVAFETGFRIERGLSAGGPFTALATTAANATSFTDTSVGFGTVYYYRIVTVAAPESAPSVVVSAATASATALQSWRQVHFGVYSNTGDAADTADPDGDGFANLVEYALGGDPELSDAFDFAPVAGTIDLSGASYLTLSYPLLADRTGITFLPQATGSLVSGVWDAAVLVGPGLQNHDFNSSSIGFEAVFNETAGWSALWGAGLGTGAGGGLATDSADRAALLPDAVAAFTAPGQKAELSVAFKARVSAGTTNTAGGEGLSLGLNLVSTPPLASGAFLVAGLGEAYTNSLTSALSVTSRNNVPGTTTATSSTALTLADNAWYRLDATFTYDGGTQFTVVTRLYSLGSAGTSTPTLLDTYTITRTGLASLVGAPVYAGFQGKSTSGGGGVRAFDDFAFGDGTVTWRDPLPFGPSANRFMHLKVTSP